MERDLVRFFLEKIYGTFSFYKLNGDAIEAKVHCSGQEMVFFQKDVEVLLTHVLERAGVTL